MPVSRSAVLSLALLILLATAGTIPAQPGAPDGDSHLDALTFAGLELRGLGPAMMSGRIADVDIHPHDRNTWYVAVGSGGVWKTVNAGTTWQPIFEDQPSYSIGCVALDPNRPLTVWVGSGENVGGRHVGFGDGVYKSLDGGTTWTHMGLGESEHISEILIDPRDSDVVYVAAEGPLWSGGGDRGLFKSTDGGVTWNQILGGGPYTGVVSVVFDPRDPDVLYAATQQRIRSVAALINGGPESGIHKSTDGGTTWKELTHGLPEEDMGRIGLAVSPQKPDVVYATIELAHREGGFYRSSDGGETWQHRDDYLSGGTGPHYYQELFASPHAFDRVYQMDAPMMVTHDGGATFEQMHQDFKHGDNHAMAFLPDDPDYLLVGTDGGIYESFDLGTTWRFVGNLPVTQFYKVAVDYDTPFYNVYGGTQDNATQGGPSRTTNVHGIRNSDWFLTVFGDGHQPAVDPSNPDIVYSEWQEGNLVRFDRKTGEIVYIQPQEEPGEPADRWNWDSPIVISPHDPARLYFASQRVWRSDDRGDSWQPISGDLSRGEDRLAKQMMGRVWSYDSNWDMYAMSNFGNVTSLSESPLVDGRLYAGTDDGLLHVRASKADSTDAEWSTCGSLPNVPEYAFVNDVKADLHDADTVYAALDNHKNGDYQPYLLKSTDRCQSWTSISGNLPDRHLVWRVVQDHVEPGLLFAGTEFGVFFTVDGGGSWIELTGGVPQIPFRDLVIQQRENDLVGATFGRGFYVLDDYTPLRHVSAQALAQDGFLFPVKDAAWYIPSRPLGFPEKGYAGHSLFTAPNPPFGAVLTYYLKDAPQTLREQRREAEEKIETDGGDTPHPGWDTVRTEVREDEPAVFVTIHDADGTLLRRVPAVAEAGIHRVAWDLRYPPYRTREPGWGPDRPEGYLVPPGTYTARLHQRVRGELRELGEPQTFEVVPLTEDTALPRRDYAETNASLRRADELRRHMEGVNLAITDAQSDLDALREALQNSAANPSFDAKALDLANRLHDLNETLNGNEQMADRGEPAPPSLSDRLAVFNYGNRFSTYGPTPTHLRNLELASEGFAELREKLRQILDVELPALQQQLNVAGVAWTSGRGVP